MKDGKNKSSFWNNAWIREIITAVIAGIILVYVGAILPKSNQNIATLTPTELKTQIVEQKQISRFTDTTASYWPTSTNTVLPTNTPKVENVPTVTEAPPPLVNRSPDNNWVSCVQGFYKIEERIFTVEGTSICHLFLNENEIVVGTADRLAENVNNGKSDSQTPSQLLL